MTCPSCGSPMVLEADNEYLVCKSCGQIHFPDADTEGVRILGEPSGQSCPICAVPLVHAAISGNRIRFCEHCRGMLISIGAFVAAIADLRALRQGTAPAGRPPDPRSLDRHINCPQCGGLMETHPYLGPGNVIIDTCEYCELHWLDHNELERIVRAPDHYYSQDA